jgi:hypothetical protein
MMSHTLNNAHTLLKEPWMFNGWKNQKQTTGQVRDSGFQSSSLELPFQCTGLL